MSDNEVEGLTEILVHVRKEAELIETGEVSADQLESETVDKVLYLSDKAKDIIERIKDALKAID